jgi:hypothetical protein
MMSAMGLDEEFYEDDEPVEEVLRAFAAGERGRTGRYLAGRTEYLVIKGLSQAAKTVFESANTANLVTS